MQETKICIKCKKELLATTEYFHKDKTKKYGFRDICKECVKKYKEENKEHIAEKIKQWRKENKEHVYEYDKQYKMENKDIIHEKHLKWRELNLPKTKTCNNCGEELPVTNFSKDEGCRDGFCTICKKCVSEKMKIYRNSDIEAEKARCKHFSITHKEHLQEYRRQWRMNHKHHLKQYYQKNKDKIYYKINKRRSLKKKLPSTLTLEQWEQIQKDFDYKCAYCGQETKLTQDHFKALSKGGEYTHDNIIPACKSCNCSKHAKNFFEWYPKYMHYSKKRENFILNYLNYTDNGEQQLSIAL